MTTPWWVKQWQVVKYIARKIRPLGFMVLLELSMKCLKIPANSAHHIPVPHSPSSLALWFEQRETDYKNREILTTTCHLLDPAFFYNYTHAILS